MLSDRLRERVARQVKSFTNAYTTAKGVGYNVKAMALPTYDSQDDFDRCRPEDVGQDFREHNEFIAEILKGLIANGVPAEPVVFYYSEFSKGLNGQRHQLLKQEREECRDLRG